MKVYFKFHFSVFNNRFFIGGFLLLVCGLFFCCDKIEFPYIRPEPVAAVDTVQKIQKVLLEEYTGHSCGNCPTAAATAIGLQQARSGKLIIVEFHYGTLAQPLAPPYTYDFRTATGNEYGSFFKTESHPVGLVNRIDFPENNHLKLPGTWSGIIDSLLNSGPKVFIQLSNSFNQSTNELNINVKIDVLDTLSGQYKLVLLLTEDSIQQAQLDDSKPSGQENVLDYWHRHVFRCAITGTWGDEVITSLSHTVSLPGEKSEKNYSYIVPANFAGFSGLNSLPSRYDQCHVVAFIYNAASSSSSSKIIQVEEMKII